MNDNIYAKHKIKPIEANVSKKSGNIFETTVDGQAAHVEANKFEDKNAKSAEANPLNIFSTSENSDISTLADKEILK